jgi:hypothetical protein
VTGACSWVDTPGQSADPGDGDGEDAGKARGGTGTSPAIRVRLCVDDEDPPFSFVIVEGTAANSEADQAQLVSWAARLGGRYMGPTGPKSSASATASPGSW